MNERVILCFKRYMAHCPRLPITGHHADPEVCAGVSSLGKQICLRILAGGGGGEHSR